MGRPVLDETGKPYRNVKGSGVKSVNIIKNEAVEYEKWPEWAKELAVLRNPEDIGIGDTLKTQIGTIGKLVIWTSHKLNFNCGCENRQERLNKQYPYTSLPIALAAITQQP